MASSSTDSNGADRSSGCQRIGGASLRTSSAWAIEDRVYARSPQGIGGSAYIDPANLTDEAIECYFTPLVASPLRKTQLNRHLAAYEPNPLLAIEPALHRCTTPTRMVWGAADQLFPVVWAEWLDRTLPQSRGVRLVEGGKLFWPEEMPDVIAEEARALWNGS
jgi:haloalkane dehalogenase